MATQPEDHAPQQRAVAIPADVTDHEDFMAELREAVHQVVLTDISAIEAAHAAAEQTKVKMSVKLDLCVLPLAIVVFIVLQLLDEVIFAEAAALVPNVGLLIVRAVRGISF